MIDAIFKKKNSFIKKDNIYIDDHHADISYPESSYDSLFEIEDNSFWFYHRNRYIEDTLRRFPAKNNSIVDVGGGNGIVAKHMQNMGCNVLLVEPSLAGAMNASKRRVKNIVSSLITDNTINNNSIPSISLFDVLEHIENDSSFINLLYKKIESDGRLYVTVPAYMFLWSEEDVEAGHFRRYTKTELIKILKGAGFTIEYSRYFFSMLVLPIYFIRVLYNKTYKKNGIADKKYHLSNEVPGNRSFFRSIIDIVLVVERFFTIRLGSLFGSSIIVVARKST